MDEVLNASVEQEQTGDAFLEGLDDTEATDRADQPVEGAEEKDPAEAPETTGEETGGREEPQPGGKDTGDGAPAETGEGDGAQAPPEEGAGEGQQASPTWSVKHMGAERTITAAEITPELLQKGMDYDRVRGKYEEAKPVMEMFHQFAQRAGMSVTDYVRHIRAQAMTASGMSEAEARRTVELEDREAAVAQAEQLRQEEAALRAESDGRIQRDLAEFARAFPQIYEQAKSDPRQIPQRVWDQVNGGMSLTAAYSRYAVEVSQAQARQAEAQARTAARNQVNAARATGSMKTAGSEAKGGDPFLEGFGE